MLLFERFLFFFLYISVYIEGRLSLWILKKKKNANYNGVWATSWETPVLEDSRANYNNMLFFFFVFFPPEEKIWPPASLSRVAFSPLIEEKEAVGVIKEGSLEVERGIKE